MLFFEMAIILCFKLPFQYTLISSHVYWRKCHKILWLIHYFLIEASMSKLGPMRSWLRFGIVVFWIQVNQVAPEEIPNVPTVFFSVHILVWLWISMSVFFVCMNVCVCDFGSWQALVGRQVAAEVIPNSPLNGLLNSSASPPRAAQHKLTPSSMESSVCA